MALGDQAAGRVNNILAAKGDVTSIQQRAGLPLGTQTQRLVGDQLSAAEPRKRPPPHTHTHTHPTNPSAEGTSITTEASTHT
jgi:hypothetical protein